MVLTPVQAPNANACAGRWIRTIRAECLDWPLIVGRQHLERVLRVYVGTTAGIGRIGRWDCSHPARPPLRCSSAGISAAAFIDATYLAVSSMSTNELHEFMHPTPDDDAPVVGVPRPNVSGRLRMFDAGAWIGRAQVWTTSKVVVSSAVELPPTQMSKMELSRTQFRSVVLQ